MPQMPLPLFEQIPNSAPDKAELFARYFVDDLTSCSARVELEAKYAALLMPTDRFNRKLVSYQANKRAGIHRWFKYKEGFSAALIEDLFHEFGVNQTTKVLDPFAGSATTLLVAQKFGIDATGIELLPPCHLAWKAKSRYHDYDVAVLRRIREWIVSTPVQYSDHHFPHITITESAFAPEQEAALLWYQEQFAQLDVDNSTKELLNFLLMSVLEDVSFTRKDGQYLRWDSRSNKAQQRDAQRLKNGKSPYKSFNKGRVLKVKEALLKAFDLVIHDLTGKEGKTERGQQTLLQGSTLEILPTLHDPFDVVVTSPPYCNRYDYTRTYALELAFMGLGEHEVIQLRQAQLSCTVENRSKQESLKAIYARAGRLDDFYAVSQAVNMNAAYQEIFEAMGIRDRLGQLNNRGIVQMVRGYFTELAFVIFELFRVSRSGARVAIVNDNVRYGGEIIPVDLLMTDIAAAFGFSPEVIYVLPELKGNSSQQMGKYGREALRKSILVWKKL